MASFSTYPSGSTAGAFISITTTSSPGQTIHTRTSVDSPGRQRIRLDAFNVSGADVLLTIQWGGTTAADEIKILVPFQAGPFTVIPDWLLLNGKIIKAYAATQPAVHIYVEALDER